MARKLTTQQFIEKAKEVHGDIYDYSLVEYVNSDSNVILFCKEHGQFTIRAANHTSYKRGCKKCSANKLSKQYRKTTEEFIKESNITHNNFYNYEKTNYYNCNTKVIITCPLHGDFEQVPSNHKLGKGCIKCGITKVSKSMKENSNGWTYTNWKKTASTSKNFDSFKVYIIKCWNDEEEFYKIGKTYNVIKRRFKNVNLPYNYETIKIFRGTAENMSKLEKKLQKKNKEFKYIPKIRFNGMYECFTKITD